MDRQSAWQRQWREALGVSTKEMPDISQDYVLHFDLWEEGEDVIRRCFAVFPHGDRLFKRVLAVLKGASQTISDHSVHDDQTLLNKLEALNDNIERVLNQYGDTQLIALNEQKQTASARLVYRGDEEQRQEIMQWADSPTIHLDDDLSQIITTYCGEEGFDAYLFLREPLYQLSGCYYALSHWVMWAMVEHVFDVDPYQPAVDLHYLGAQPGWSDDALFVFVES
ncbi:hypothetical protein JCM19237_4659 [Photobacterium aphoticum]|uniref:Uncharacterized protein n=1 Tax=Photobacterium aphoticum TaxID=754436 RepID=A0A090QY94_9GAMM|nr:hypothetical protein JCM19237_4659 [Photobacterium aphoticum]